MNNVKRLTRESTGRKNKISFGSVTVLSDIPSETEVRKNVKEGSRVMAQLLKKIQTPGVSIKYKKDVPYYHADPKNPSFLIRHLNGKQERVLLKNGKFVVCK